MNEGQIWEAALFAGHHRLDNLVAILDYNKLQIDGFTKDVLGLEPLNDKWRAFGWHVENVDGHDIGALCETLEDVRHISGQPSIVLAHTVKGKGVTFVEADYTFHGRALTPEQAEQAREELQCC